LAKVAAYENSLSADSKWSAAFAPTMTPFTDAVGFINSNQPNTAGAVQLLQAGNVAGGQFWCDVYQLVLASPCPARHLAREQQQQHLHLKLPHWCMICC
jgi:hypothetical protein